MSHLGDLLSAVVDGELSGAELDRANAHLAACAACRTEAQDLRRLKDALHALPGADDCAAVTRRLLALPAPDAAPPGGTGAPPGAAAGRRRGRYVLWGTVSLVVVGIGTAAFGLGGGEGTPEPRITPQFQVFDFQHALTSGDVPFADPSDVSPRVPVASARP